MSLDVTLTHPSGRKAYSANITHNLTAMAAAAGIYMHLWRPEEIGVSKASDLVAPLRDGLAKLGADPAKFEAYNSPNGWGLYKHFAPFVRDYMHACEDNPDASVHACR